MRKRSTNVALGAVLMAGLGYVAGILTAPKSGKDTREDLSRAAVKAKSEAEQKLKALHAELGELIDQGKVRAKDVQDSAHTELADLLGRAQMAKQKAREVLSAMHEGDAEDKDLKKAVDEVKKAIKHLSTYLAKK